MRDDSMSVDVTLLGAGLGSDEVVGCGAGRKMFERECSCVRRTYALSRENVR